MLPLLSITKPMLTGISSRAKTEMRCSTLSSNTLKLSCFKSGTNWPLASSTVACRTTRSTSLLSVAPGGDWGSFCCCPPLNSSDGLAPGGGGGSACARAGADARKVALRKSARIAIRGEFRKRANSVAGGEITRAGENFKRRQSVRRAPTHFDFLPFSVAGAIFWPIAENILIPQLHADLRRDVGKIVEAGHSKSAAAGHFRELAQQAGSATLLWGGIVGANIIDADCVHLDIRFFQVFADIHFSITTMVVPAIRYDEQSFL